MAPARQGQRDQRADIGAESLAGPKGDDFYRFVGEVYGKAATVSTRPAAELAKAWEVPVTTVHRWIREARRRGHLPPAEPGRRG
jgi:hypothetical protein